MSKKKIIQYCLLITGSILFPVGVVLFISPWQLNTGGLIGVAQILSYVLCGGSALTGIINTALNIPLFILAWRSLSKRFLFKTLISILIQSVLLSVLPVPAQPILPDTLSNVIFGAVIGGIGIGLCLQSSGSAGGLDILGMYVSMKKPNFSVGQLSYVINLLVELFATSIFGLENALYSTIFILLAYFVSDKIHLQNITMYGIIVSDCPELKDHLLHDLHRGVTVWNGYGAYTGQPKEILLCTMNRYEVRTVRKIIHQYDPNAFFLLSKAKAVSSNFERRLLSE